MLTHESLSTFTRTLLGYVLAHERTSALTHTLLGDMLAHYGVSRFSVMDLSTSEKHGYHSSTNM